MRLIGLPRAKEKELVFFASIISDKFFSVKASNRN